MSLLAQQIIIFALGSTALISGIWLFAHARDVARVFRTVPDIEPGPGRTQARRNTVVGMLILFNLSWIGALVFWALLYGAVF